MGQWEKPVAKITIVRVRKQIRSAPPSHSSNPLTISADEVDWAYAMYPRDVSLRGRAKANRRKIIPSSIRRDSTVDGGLIEMLVGSS
jgi:hypothetical protein